jgi:hypothetical protein
MAPPIAASSNPTPATPKGSRIEVYGARYLRALASRERAVAADAVHVLNDDERRALSAIERGAIVRAGIAGALSGVACAIPAILLPPVAAGADFAAHARHWGIIGGITVVASVLEIVWLYWDGLRAVHALAHAAGLDLAAHDDDDPSSVVWALARAALELPNPPDGVVGLDPMREASKLKLVVASTVYKLKVALTGFVLKALVRRALGRAATRAVLELIAAPVTAIWDAVVCGLIVREAKLRVLGPSAAMEFVAMLLPEKPSEALAESALRAVGAAIVRTEDLHPNHVALLRTLRTALGREAPDGVDDSARFLTSLKALTPDEQVIVLRVLATASIIDGQLARAEARLLDEAFVACGRRYDRAVIEQLRKAFVSGDPIPRSRVEAIG